MECLNNNKCKMNGYSTSTPRNPEDFYQKQKIYIENIAFDGPSDIYEKELKAFLSRYGTIIDIKVLKNRKFSRTTEVLCIRDLS